MSKLTLVVNERELSTLRAALFLLQEHIDALPEDLAEMIGRHRTPVAASEIEKLSARLDAPTSTTRGYAGPEYLKIKPVIEIDRVSAPAVPR